MTGVTIVPAGLLVDVAFQERELLLEAAHPLQLGGLLRGQQLLHPLKGAQHLALTQAALGESTGVALGLAVQAQAIRTRIRSPWACEPEA